MLPSATEPTASIPTFLYAPHLAPATRAELPARLTALGAHDYVLTEDYAQAKPLVVLAPLSGC